VGEVDDPLEHEAARLADRVMTGRPTEPLHERTQAGPDLREMNGSVATETPLLHGGGSPLPSAARAFFEPGFGHDFASVRIHSDSEAASLAASFDARAFTLGRHIVFGSGEYSTATGEGRRLLAHELAHVTQQQGSPALIQRQPKGNQPPPAPPQALTSQELAAFNDDVAMIYATMLPYQEWYKLENVGITLDEEENKLVKLKLEAITRLGELRNDRAVLTLVGVLEETIHGVKKLKPQNKPGLQEAAAEALGKIGSQAAFTKLNSLMTSQDPKERRLGILGFSAATGSAEAVAALRARLKLETDPGTKFDILIGLGRVGSDLANQQQKEDTVKVLIDEMKNNIGQPKLAAIRALGMMRLKSATDALLHEGTIWHTKEIVENVVTALGEIGDVNAVDFLVIRLEKDGHPSVRGAAAIALGKIGNKKAMDALRRAQDQEKDDSVKASIKRALVPPVQRVIFR
jgi:HEAT repeat protein